MSEPESGLRFKIRDRMAADLLNLVGVERATDDIMGVISSYVASQLEAAEVVRKHMLEFAAGHLRRVNDLLEANNRYQQEARDARADRKRLLEALAPLAHSSIDISGTAAIGISREEIATARLAFDEISSALVKATPPPAARVY